MLNDGQLYVRPNRSALSGSGEISYCWLVGSGPKLGAVGIVKVRHRVVMVWRIVSEVLQ